MLEKYSSGNKNGEQKVTTPKSSSSTPKKNQLINLMSDLDSVKKLRSTTGAGLRIAIVR